MYRVCCSAVLFFLVEAAFAEEQPIQFNHKIHIEEGLECRDCHTLVHTEQTAGRPLLEVCAGCHEKDESKNPEIRKVAQAIERGEEISWRRIGRLPDDVFFSHRRHVEAGKLTCNVCHGKMEEQKTPPAKPLVKISMKMCTDCHTKELISNDCLRCHR